jgi:hypothetical protein
VRPDERTLGLEQYQTMLSPFALGPGTDQETKPTAFLYDTTLCGGMHIEWRSRV